MKEKDFTCDHTICNWHPCFYSKACSFRMQSSLGYHERNSICDWNSRPADRAVCCRPGSPRGSSFAPCTVGSIFLAGFERNVKICAQKKRRHGTYTAENRVIHAQLTSDLEQSTKCWDFRITQENRETELEMDYPSTHATLFYINHAELFAFVGRITVVFVLPYC